MEPLKAREPHRTKQVYEGHQQMFNALNSNVGGKIMSKETVKTITTCIKTAIYPLFPQIAIILNSNLSDSDDNDLPVDQRTTLRSCLCASSTFVHVFLFQLSPEISQIISHLPAEVAVGDILYGDFCHFISSPTVDSALSLYDVQFVKRTLDRIRALKNKFRTIKSRIKRSGIFNGHETSIYVHRLAPAVPNIILDQCPAYGKIPLLRTPNDGIDESLFPPDKYHSMHMTSSNTIHPNGEHPQVHIIVKSNAPDSSVIKKKYRDDVKKGKPQDITRESWVTAIQIYNVFTDFPEILEMLNDQMRCNIERRATIIRGKLRHNGGQGVMFGVGEIRDQHGNVGPFRNMGTISNTSKYAIEEEAADVLDTCIKIAECFFPSLINFWRHNGLDSYAIPNSLRQLTITGFGTQEYAGPFHPDSNDTRFTLAFRFMRGPKEPPVAYQFCLANDQLVKSDGIPGVIIEQPSGCFGLWEGVIGLHASSCDPRRVNKMVMTDSPGSTGLVCTQNKLILNQTVKHKGNTMRLADMMSFQRKNKIEQEEWLSVKRCYSHEKVKGCTKKKQKLA